jgi:hypothetical protein
VRITLIIAVAIMIGPSLAYGSPSCMTQSEARAKFPKAHLFYMRGSKRCWDVGEPVHSPRRSARPVAPAPPAQPALAIAHGSFTKTETVSNGIGAAAECQYSPCE